MNIEEILNRPERVDKVESTTFGLPREGLSCLWFFIVPNLLKNTDV